MPVRKAAEVLPCSQDRTPIPQALRFCGFTLEFCHSTGLG